MAVTLPGMQQPPPAALMAIDRPPSPQPGSMPLLALVPQRLKRQASASAEQSIEKRTVFGGSDYENVVLGMAERFTALVQTCQDPSLATFGYRFDGYDRHGDGTKDMYLGITAKLVEADVFGPVVAGTESERRRRFRIGFRVWDRYGPIPIWEELANWKLPLEVYVICGTPEPQLKKAFVDILDPWLYFLHKRYGMTSLPRNWDLGPGE